MTDRETNTEKNDEAGREASLLRNYSCFMLSRLFWSVSRSENEFPNCNRIDSDRLEINYW